MPWHTTESVDEFHEAAGDFLRSRPVEHTVPITLVDTMRERGSHFYGPDDPVFGWWRSDGGPVTGAFLQTPPFPLLLTAAPDVPELVDLLRDRPLPGVNGLTPDAEEFASAWRQETGAGTKTDRQSRLFRLGVLTPPRQHAPGRPRVIQRRDRGLLIGWLAAFHREIGEEQRDLAALVDEKLAYGGFTLWEIDNVPVSMAGATRMEAGMVRVQGVYTPPEFRGRGFAAAVTTAVTRAALDAGTTDVVLFTDLANPTSNALYERLGYRPVEDRTVVRFTA